jgi:hypothetical protein
VAKDSKSIEATAFIQGLGLFDNPLVDKELLKISFQCSGFLFSVLFLSSRLGDHGGGYKALTRDVSLVGMKAMSGLWVSMDDLVRQGDRNWRSGS